MLNWSCIQHPPYGIHHVLQTFLFSDGRSHWDQEEGWRLVREVGDWEVKKVSVEGKGVFMVAALQVLRMTDPFPAAPQPHGLSGSFWESVGSEATGCCFHMSFGHWGSVWITGSIGSHGASALCGELLPISAPGQSVNPGGSGQVPGGPESLLLSLCVLSRSFIMYCTYWGAFQAAEGIAEVHMMIGNNCWLSFGQVGYFCTSSVFCVLPPIWSL